MKKLVTRYLVIGLLALESQQGYGLQLTTSKPFPRAQLISSDKKTFDLKADQSYSINPGDITLNFQGRQKAQNVKISVASEIVQITLATLNSHILITLKDASGTTVHEYKLNVITGEIFSTTQIEPSKTTPQVEPGKTTECVCTKEQWTAMGIKNGWFGPGSQLPTGTSEDLQKMLDKEALDKLLERISKEANISNRKLPLVKEAVEAFWNDAGRGQKTSMKLLPNYLFKALEQGDDTAAIAGMLGIWMGMPETTRDAWRSATPDEIGKFLKERYTLQRLVVIPTKPDDPKTIKPTAPQKDTRTLEEQAQGWDENKINREMTKRRFTLLTGPGEEKDPKKREAINKEIDILEIILEKKQKEREGK